MEVYVDDMVMKSKRNEDHLVDLAKSFDAFCMYQMRLNPIQCPKWKVFGIFSDSKWHLGQLESD